jgi:hypothetical protein
MHLPNSCTVSYQESQEAASCVERNQNPSIIIREQMHSMYMQDMETICKLQLLLHKGAACSTKDKPGYA